LVERARESESESARERERERERARFLPAEQLGEYGSEKLGHSCREPVLDRVHRQLE
jgi:hypothetical protein